MNERDKLIEELNHKSYALKFYAQPEEMIRLADFILADRKRICEPLRKYTQDKWTLMEALPKAKWVEAINETLTLAGLIE